MFHHARRRLSRVVGATLALLSAGSLLLYFAQPVPAQGSPVINGHPVSLDSQGKLVSWLAPPEGPYAGVVRRAWGFLLNGVRTESNGLKSYYTHSYVDPNTLASTDWPHNPAGVFAMLTESALGTYAFGGDQAVMDFARRLMDYHLAHGMTPADWRWGGVPYASSDGGATEYRGAGPENGSGRGDGAGVIEPDKVGELGFAYLRLYEFTGDVRYRDAAVRAADALARNVRPGDATHSPWPFRVVAQSGVAREEYCAAAISPIKLFDELIRLQLGDVARYRDARQTAWTWLMAYPMTNNVWANYFEDVETVDGPSNLNQLVALETARYLLLRPDLDPQWQAHAQSILRWVEATFGQPQYGALTIAEQLKFPHPMGSHTARYASVTALWYERTGDVQAKDKAFRSFNWATYMARADGRVIDGPSVGQLWWTDGYGDYIRHFLAGMGAVPEWAPADSSHLLRSTSVVKTISYGKGVVAYETFDPAATEVLRLSFAPQSVTAGADTLSQREDLSAPGWTYDATLGVLRLRHDSATRIEVRGEERAGTQPPYGFLVSAAPDGTPAPAAPPTSSGSSQPVATPAHIALPAPAGDPNIVSFDDQPGENRPLNGEGPAGVLDWGNGEWFLSGPWMGLTTKSVSFSGNGATQGTMRFVSPRRLVSLQAYNGGASPTAIVLSCPGQPDVQATVAPGELATVATGWGATCTSVTVGSSNGWDTNFDNLALG